MALFPFDGEHVHILSPFEHLQGVTPRSLRAQLHRVGLIDDLSLATWLTHPAHLVRGLLGRRLPRLATTAALVHPGTGF